MATLIDQAQHYLADLLPGDVSKVETLQPSGMPYFLLDAFEFGQLHIHGQRVVLAASRQATSQQTLHRMLTRLQKIVGCRVLYVAPRLSTYERKRLLTERVEFVVPDSQLFAPSLAMDLRESATRSLPPSEVLKLGPATQAVLLTLLLNDTEALPTLNVARKLGYSPMTASRANRELEAAGLARVYKIGTRSTLALTGSREEVWQRAKHVMDTPVQKQLHVTGPRDLLRLAGESALAEFTLLAPPIEPVFAISPNDWRAFESQFTIFPEGDSNTIRLQVWSYHTWLLDDAPTVDPLSLIVSLQDETDERVQIALEELESTHWLRSRD